MTIIWARQIHICKDNVYPLLPLFICLFLSNGIYCFLFQERQFLTISNYVFTVIFALEMFLKVCTHIVLFHIDDSAQDCSNSNGLTVELLQCYAKPLICWFSGDGIGKHSLLLLCNIYIKL